MPIAEKERRHRAIRAYLHHLASKITPFEDLRSSSDQASGKCIAFVHRNMRTQRTGSQSVLSKSRTYARTEYLITQADVSALLGAKGYVEEHLQNPSLQGRREPTGSGLPGLRRGSDSPGARATRCASQAARAAAATCRNSSAS